MKYNLRTIKGKRIVGGDPNLATKHEIHVSKIPEELGIQSNNETYEYYAYDSSDNHWLMDSALHTVLGTLCVLGAIAEIWTEDGKVYESFMVYQGGMVQPISPVYRIRMKQKAYIESSTYGVKGELDKTEVLNVLAKSSGLIEEGQVLQWEEFFPDDLWKPITENEYFNSIAPMEQWKQ